MAPRARSSSTLAGLLLVSLLAAGCTTETGLAFGDLLPGLGGTPISSPPGGSEPGTSPGSDPLADPTVWFSSADGYALQLPPGWNAARLGSLELEMLLAVLDAEEPQLGLLIRDVLASTGLRVSMLGGDLAGGAVVPPIVAVLTEPIGDRRPARVAAHAQDLIEGIPGIVGEVVRSDDRLPTGDATRFDFRLEDPEVGGVTVRSYLFRYGDDAYLVTFAASDDAFEQAEPTFASIVDSLRFGV